MQLSKALLNGSVLIVDDDTDALEEMADGLHSYGLAVHTAKNEVMALNLANQYRPQWIIMDYFLREYCGLDAIKAIRTFLPDIRVIMVSGQEDIFRIMTPQNRVDTGVVAVLKKPIAIDIIREFISGQLQPGYDRPRSITR
jgi:ActR/RegA family two-component response regulator|tara:strand:+ start:176 stop:598 length:423 start_codon:yes stop_codon:yes gene_type:complete